MDPVIRKLDNAEKALQRFQEILEHPASEVIRDSAILRFAVAIETAWKAARAVIDTRVGPERLTSAGPKPVVRESQIAGLLTEAQAEAALQMINDRNLTVHVYDEAVAIELFARLPAHAALIRAWVEAMRAAVARS